MRSALPLLLLPAFALAGCDSTGGGAGPRPDTPAGLTEAPPDAPIRVEYVCGNRFLVINAHAHAVQVSWVVQGSDEHGAVSLPPAPTQDPAFSETEVVTRIRGTLTLYEHGRAVQDRPNDALICSPDTPSPSFLSAGTSTAGRWSAPFSWPIVALHASLLYNGQVLSWGKFGQPYLWDPATSHFSQVPLQSWIFCAGHAFLPDGRLLVAGGHLSDDHGIPEANVFSPRYQTWTRVGSMARGRWYPTNTELADGSILTLAGRDANGVTVPLPEIWSSAGWRALTGASRNLAYYPRSFLAPNGKVFYAGESQTSRYLSTSGAGAWTTVGLRQYGTRDYGAAVMYEPGKILYAGGGRTTATAEIVDLNQGAPAWQYTGSMAYPRRHLNATLLPDGTVLVTGGSSGTSFSDYTRGVHAAELWTPATGAWTTLASNTVTRVYHATSLLLPDGRVLHTGSGDASGQPDQRNAELFSPPYLFKGARPTISSAPTRAAYGSAFTVTTADAASITRVALIGLGSVTHAFDMGQRYLTPGFSRTSTGLTVTAPSTRNTAPPGFYMLFVLNGSGVPSVAKFIRIG